MEKDESLRIRLPKEIKDKFKKVCKQELTDVSTKIRQFILKEIKKKKL